MPVSERKILQRKQSRKRAIEKKNRKSKPSPLQTVGGAELGLEWLMLQEWWLTVEDQEGCFSISDVNMDIKIPPRSTVPSSGTQVETTSKKAGSIGPMKLRSKTMEENAKLVLSILRFVFTNIHGFSTVSLPSILKTLCQDDNPMMRRSEEGLICLPSNALETLKMEFNAASPLVGCMSFCFKCVPVLTWQLPGTSDSDTDLDEFEVVWWCSWSWIVFMIVVFLKKIHELYCSYWYDISDISGQPCRTLHFQPPNKGPGVGRDCQYNSANYCANSIGTYATPKVPFQQGRGKESGVRTASLFSA
mgnify:CR=1 FL=1